MNNNLKTLLVLFPYSIVIGGILLFFYKKSKDKTLKA